MNGEHFTPGHWKFGYLHVAILSHDRKVFGSRTMMLFSGSKVV